MKLTRSIAVVAALTSMSFAGGMIMEPAYENETVVVPVEPVYVAPEPVYVAPPAPPAAVVVEKAPVKVVVEKVPVKVVPVPVTTSKLYIAGGLTDVAIRSNGRVNLFGDENNQDRQIGLTGRVGYDFMDYLGAELRGTYGIAKDKGSKFKQVGAYLKPNYNVTDAINLYGLLGASKTNVGVGSDTGFSYGAGLDYGISDKVSVFTDVVNYMKKSNTAAQWGLTLGAGYRF
jgi:hypothetical protein